MQQEYWHYEHTQGSQSEQSCHLMAKITHTFVGYIDNANRCWLKLSFFVFVSFFMATVDCVPMGSLCFPPSNHAAERGQKKR